MSEGKWGGLSACARIGIQGRGSTETAAMALGNLSFPTSVDTHITYANSAFPKSLSFRQG